MTYIPKTHTISPANITIRMQRTVADIMQRAGVDTPFPDEPITYSQGVVTFRRFVFDGGGSIKVDSDYMPVTEESSVGIASRGDRDWLEALRRVLDGPRLDVYRGAPARLSADVQRGTRTPTTEEQ